MTEAKAIRNSVEGRDVPPYPHVDHDHRTGEVRGPSATELHTRALAYYRRGYAEVDAAGNAGIALADFQPSEDDHRAHDAVWNGAA